MKKHYVSAVSSTQYPSFGRFIVALVAVLKLGSTSVVFLLSLALKSTCSIAEMRC